MTKVKKNSDKSFIVQGSLLAIAGVITKIIGAVYRVPLVNILGDADILQPPPCSIKACLGKKCYRTVPECPQSIQDCSYLCFHGRRWGGPSYLFGG